MNSIDLARLARVVVPSHPHHVTQRGNGRARTFFGDRDDALYRDPCSPRITTAGLDRFVRRCVKLVSAACGFGVALGGMNGSGLTSLNQSSHYVLMRSRVPSSVA